MIVTKRIALAAIAFTALATTACRTDRDTRAEEEDTLAAAATTPATPAQPVAIRPAAATYRADTSGGQVVLQVGLVTRNSAADTVFLATCGRDTPSYVVERREGDEWNVVLRPICPMILTPPIVIAPGATHEHTFTLRGSLARPGAVSVADPRFESGEVAGTYRIVYDAYRRGWSVNDPGPDPDARLPAEQRRSAPFEVRL